MHTSTTQAPVHEGESLVLDVRGEPGDLVAVFVSPLPGYLPSAAHQGVLLTGDPSLAVVLGPLDSHGHPSLASHVPPLGVEGLTLHRQGAFQPPSEPFVFGSWTASVLLQAGF